tara:strand:- start:181 stop:375 length:195 start_codon:yes stop_codon:yes gene_type:complete
MFSNENHTLDLPITQDQLDRWASGELVQNAFPGLTRGQREFIISGITENEWVEYEAAMEEMYSE